MYLWLRVLFIRRRCVDVGFGAAYVCVVWVDSCSGECGVGIGVGFGALADAAAAADAAVTESNHVTGKTASSWVFFGCHRSARGH